MKKMKWDPSLSVGIEAIDTQHQRLVDFLNQLGEAHDEKDRKKVSEVLVGLTDYTINHFSFEERLMEKSGYPLSKEHKSVHDSFVARLSALVERHQQGEDVTRKLRSEIQIWLYNHIKREDNDYATYASGRAQTTKSWLKLKINKLFPTIG